MTELVRRDNNGNIYLIPYYLENQFSDMVYSLRDDQAEPIDQIDNLMIFNHIFNKYAVEFS